MAVIIDSALTNPDHPRICYNNLSAAATVTASTEASGFAKENVQNALTWNFWQPTTQTSFLEFDFGSPTAIDYIGIAGHNCGTQGNTINIQYWDGLSPGSWVTIDTTTPTDDSVILFLFASSNHQIFKVEFTGGSVPNVASIFMGNQLTMQRTIYGGHSPVTMSKKTVIRPNKSEGGQWLGRSTIRQSAIVNAEFKNLTASWFRANFEPFMNDAIDDPFFFAWRPTTYPTELAYCWTGGDLTASNMGQADLMQVSLSASARLE